MYRPSAVVIKDNANGAGGLDFDSWADQTDIVSPTASHCFDVSSEMCFPGGKQRR